MRTNVILIDYENVQPASLAALEPEHYRVVVFVGAAQAKLPFDLVSSIQRMGERAEYVKIPGTGPNTLDLHIAFYIGQLAAQDPGTFFHIISKDTGFDPLIRHLKARHIYSARSESIEEMPLVKADGKKVSEERAKAYVKSLCQPKSTRPRTDKTLARAIIAYFGNQQLSDSEVSGIIAAMQTSRAVTISDGKVAYSLG